MTPVVWFDELIAHVDARMDEEFKMFEKYKSHTNTKDSELARAHWERYEFFLALSDYLRTTPLKGTK